MRPYRYDSLDPTAKTIRLMELLPGNFDHDIYVLLRNAILDDENIPTYEALSYTWGSLEQQPDIKIATHQELSTDPVYDDLAVTRNLDEALRYLRCEKSAREFWIDAICVDQQNLEERGDQVQRMADIYGNARRVIAWLGPTSHRTSFTMETLRFLSSQVDIDVPGVYMEPRAGADSHWADLGTPLPYDEETWHSLHSLLSSSWFKRLWIWQEIVLARPAMIQCGHETLDWAAFRTAIFCLRLKNAMHPDEPEGVFQRLRRLLHQACDLTQCNGLYEFDNALAVTENCLCTDPRDRVYALLNIVSSVSGVMRLKPDYTRATRSVYQDAVLGYLDQTGSLALVAFRDWDPEEIMKPTWVPDLSKPRNGCYDRNWQPPRRSCWGSKAEAQYMGDGILRATGLYCAEIRSVETLSVDRSQDDFSVVALLRRLALKVDVQVPYLDGSPMSDALARVLCLDSWDGESIPSLAAYPIYVGSGRASALQFVRKVLETGEDRLETLSDDFKSNEEFLSKVYLRAVESTFIITKEGYIGLAPKTVQAGDKVCIVLGCPSLLILRPGVSGRYTVVGSCYVQGLMDGSLLLGALAPEWRYQTHPPCEKFNSVFFNQLTGQYLDEDPRLGQLPFPWRRAHLGDIMINDDTGEVTQLHDPRLSAEALRKRGVPLQDFILE
ncbi:MAG: hypothetical protein Q9168_007323 [Polycauliona sp. 1 TL-2023]